jgi:hypothetical protein
MPLDRRLAGMRAIQEPAAQVSIDLPGSKAALRVAGIDVRATIGAWTHRRT